MDCKVEGCGPVAGRHGLGFCSKHYQRYKKHGDPTYTVNAPRDLGLEDHLKWKGWSVSDSGCWVYDGATDGWGYGILNHKGRMLGAHRVAYAVWVGDITDELIVRHTCDNPPCINPKHLLSGTHGDNASDRGSRNRAGAAKVTVEQVLEIRHLRNTIDMTLQQIADTYGLSRDGVASIVYRKNWKYV